MENCINSPEMQASSLQNVHQAEGLAGQVGNQALTVKDIVDEAVKQPTEAEKLERERRQKLAETLVSYDTEVEEEQYALSVDGVGFFALRDIHGVKAKQKHGKTSCLKVCGAALLCGQQFRVKSELTAPKVLWLDTEQNRSDVKLITTDIMQMTGLEGELVKNFLHVHALRCCNYDELYPLMEQAIKDFLPQVIIVDGVVEFVASFNDEAIAKQLVHDLQVISQTYCCAVVCVLHTNKADDDHNMRGHLGTMLAQKAGTVLECKKDRGIISIRCTESRHSEMPEWNITYDQAGNIVDADELRKQWLEQRQAELQKKRQEDSERKQQERLDYARRVISDHGGSIKRSELVQILMSKFALAYSTATGFVKEQIGKTLYELNGMVQSSSELSISL